MKWVIGLMCMAFCGCSSPAMKSKKADALSANQTKSSAHGSQNPNEISASINKTEEGATNSNNAQDSKTSSTTDLSNLACTIDFINKSGCGFMEWKKPVALKKHLSFTLKTWKHVDGSPKALEDMGDISVDLSMPTHGHGSDPISVSKVAAGEYLVEGVHFSMSGEWELRIKIQEQGRDVDQAVVPIKI